MAVAYNVHSSSGNKSSTELCRVRAMRMAVYTFGACFPDSINLYERSEMPLISAIFFCVIPAAVRRSVNDLSILPPIATGIIVPLYACSISGIIVPVNTCFFEVLNMFPERLKNLRKERDVTQVELSKAIGVSDRTCRKYESGEIEPTMTVLKHIASFFNVSVDYLIGFTDDPAIWKPAPIKITGDPSDPDNEIIPGGIYQIRATLSQVKELVEFLRKNNFGYEFIDPDDPDPQ